MQAVIGEDAVALLLGSRFGRGRGYERLQARHVWMSAVMATEGLGGDADPLEDLKVCPSRPIS